ncbi:HAD hydrolase-like protein, partial [Fructilactobacillus sanfranciscensis]|uniref:HAD hydrolase-like protein n=1 Tax=Fructilactobacillus sanfranciscensis TaxID=1625 RepID=UPI0013D564DA
IKEIKLTRFFPKIVDPSTLKHGKPSPDIYLEAAKLLKLNPDSVLELKMRRLELMPLMLQMKYLLG